MNRRTLLSALGIGVATSMSGCMSLNSEGEEHSDREREEKLDEEFQEKTLNEVYEQRVENGELVHGHNLNINSVEEITDDSVTLETTLSINPENDYTVNLHYNPVTVDENGEWVHENHADQLHGGSPPEYDEETHEWVPSDSVSYVKYKFGDAQAGEILSSMTVPSEAFWDSDVSIGQNRYNVESNNRQNIHGWGWSYVNEFELAQTPEMYETFVLTLTWEDDNTQSPRSGEVVANSVPMMRVGEDEYIRPITHNGNGVVDTSWEGSLLQDDINYEQEDVYRRETEHNDDMSNTINITRLSNYGSFSPKITGEFRDDPRAVFSTDGPSFLDANAQYPWTVSFDISREERDDAEETAIRNRTGDSQIDAVHDLINSDEVMNHDVIQDVASQLGDVCEIMGATHPTEQVRVVADFVQYLNHTSPNDGPIQFGQPTSLFTGTVHPVELLYRGGLGDCKDFTVLGNAILNQEPFNMNPSAIVLPDIVDYLAEGSDSGGSIGHVSTAIPIEEMEFEENLSPDSLSTPLSSAYETVQFEGTEYVYVEMSGPFPIGYMFEDWNRRSNPVHIDEFVN